MIAPATGSIRSARTSGACGRTSGTGSRVAKARTDWRSAALSASAAVHSRLEIAIAPPFHPWRAEAIRPVSHRKPRLPMTSPHPRLTFVELRRLLDELPQFDEGAAAATRRRDLALTKPPGALGRLEDIAMFIAGWQGRHPPRIDRPLAAVFAGNHGVVAQGVAAYPPAVTAQM